MKEERAKEKGEKRKGWYKKGNKYDSVMFLPLTPANELKRRIQERIKAIINFYQNNYIIVNLKT